MWGSESHSCGRTSVIQLFFILLVPHLAAMELYCIASLPRLQSCDFFDFENRITFLVDFISVLFMVVQQIAISLVFS